MKDKKLEEAVDYVCSCCPYIFSGSAEWDKSNPAFADGATLLPSIATGAWFAR